MLINKLLKPFVDLWFDMTTDVRWFWKYSIFIFLYIFCIVTLISFFVFFYTINPLFELFDKINFNPLFELFDKINFKKIFRKIFYKTP